MYEANAQQAVMNMAEKQGLIDGNTRKLTQSYLRDMPLEYRGVFREGPASKESLLRAKPISLDTLPILNDPLYISGGLANPRTYSPKDSAQYLIPTPKPDYSCKGSYCRG